MAFHAGWFRFGVVMVSAPAGWLCFPPERCLVSAVSPAGLSLLSSGRLVWCRVSPRQAIYFLSGDKKVAKKRRPAVRLVLRYSLLAGSAQTRSLRSLKQCAALIRQKLRSSGRTEGHSPFPQLRVARCAEQPSASSARHGMAAPPSERSKAAGQARAPINAPRSADLGGQGRRTV